MVFSIVMLTGEIVRCYSVILSGSSVDLLREGGIHFLRVTESLGTDRFVLLLPSFDDMEDLELVLSLGRRPIGMRLGLGLTVPAPFAPPALCTLSRSRRNVP